MQKIDLTRGYFGIGIYQPKVQENIGTLWRHAYLYNAAYIFSIAAKKYKQQSTDTQNVTKHIPYYNSYTFLDFQLTVPYGAKLIGIELTDDAIYLDEFKHPERAIYLLGSEGTGLPQDIIDKCDYVVKVYSPKPQSMNVSVTGTLVMYDRIIKQIRKIS